MGINGLLQSLKSISIKTHIDEYKGLRMGVDMSKYVLLHASISSCPIELAHGTPTKAYVNYIEKNLRILQHHGITPVCVFDGDSLPAKKETNQARKDTREKNRQKALEMEDRGDHYGARNAWIASLHVTTEMIKHTITALKRMGVELIVAPYEADAQLVYLQTNNYVDVCMSVDSDLIVFGCTRLFTKFDHKTGFGLEIQTKRDMHKVQGLNFANWTWDMFMMWCVLIGCDYVDNVLKHGPKKAYDNVKANGADIVALVKKMKMMHMPVPKEYVRKVKIALWCFHHMTIFCPKERILKPLQPAPETMTILDKEIKEMGPTFESEEELRKSAMHHAGDMFSNETARLIADGIVEPRSRKRYADIVPEESVASKARRKSIQHSAVDLYAKKPVRPQLRATSALSSLDQFAVKPSQESSQGQPTPCGVQLIPTAAPVHIPDEYRQSSAPVSSNNFYGSVDRSKENHGPMFANAPTQGVKRRSVDMDDAPSSAPLQSSSNYNSFGQSASSFGQSASSGRASSSKRLKPGERERGQMSIKDMFSKQKAKSNTGSDDEEDGDLMATDNELSPALSNITAILPVPSGSFDIMSETEQTGFVTPEGESNESASVPGGQEQLVLCSSEEVEEEQITPGSSEEREYNAGRDMMHREVVPSPEAQAPPTQVVVVPTPEAQGMNVLVPSQAAAQGGSQVHTIVPSQAVAADGSQTQAFAPPAVAQQATVPSQNLVYMPTQIDVTQMQAAVQAHPPPHVFTQTQEHQPHACTPTQEDFPLVPTPATVQVAASKQPAPQAPKAAAPTQPPAASPVAPQGSPDVPLLNPQQRQQAIQAQHIEQRLNQPAAPQMLDIELPATQNILQDIQIHASNAPTQINESDVTIEDIGPPPVKPFEMSTMEVERQVEEINTKIENERRVLQATMTEQNKIKDFLLNVLSEALKSFQAAKDKHEKDYGEWEANFVKTVTAGQQKLADLEKKQAAAQQKLQASMQYDKDLNDWNKKSEEQRATREWLEETQRGLLGKLAKVRQLAGQRNVSAEELVALSGSVNAPPPQVNASASASSAQRAPAQRHVTVEKNKPKAHSAPRAALHKREVLIQPKNAPPVQKHQKSASARQVPRKHPTPQAAVIQQKKQAKPILQPVFKHPKPKATAAPIVINCDTPSQHIQKNIHHQQTPAAGKALPPPPPAQQNSQARLNSTVTPQHSASQAVRTLPTAAAKESSQPQRPNRNIQSGNPKNPFDVFKYQETSAPASLVPKKQHNTAAATDQAAVAAMVKDRVQQGQQAEQAINRSHKPKPKPTLGLEALVALRKKKRAEEAAAAQRELQPASAPKRPRPQELQVTTGPRGETFISPPAKPAPRNLFGDNGEIPPGMPMDPLLHEPGSAAAVEAQLARQRATPGKRLKPAELEEKIKKSVYNPDIW